MDLTIQQIRDELLQEYNKYLPKNKDKIEDYKSALLMMKQGRSNRSISRELNIGLGSVCQLKHGTHLILEAFPELKQLMGSEIF
jgi:hypothetical protein